MRVSPLGDVGFRLDFGPGDDPQLLERTRALLAALAAAPVPGMVEAVPAFGTVTVFYDRRRVPDLAAFRAELLARAGPEATGGAGAGRECVIPVCYAAHFAPDLARVAAGADLTEAEVVARHSGADYRVAAVGFTPGFPYLAGLPDALQAPRLATPRGLVPAGSVGIGGRHTGIYPLASPGGWNLIGRTPLPLFNRAADPPALLRVGDRVRFRPITAEEFAAWR